jgi:ribosome-associated toxin RatA of RatAB toxin-antitoxin module
VNEMPKIERSIIINSPVREVFDYIADPKLTTEWLPGMIETKDINQTEKGVGSTHNWIYKMIGMRFEGKNITDEFVKDKKIVIRSEGSIKTLWNWNFELYDHGTKIDLSVEYTIPMPVLGKIAEAIVLRQNEREADLALANIKAKMEG